MKTILTMFLLFAFSFIYAEDKDDVAEKFLLTNSATRLEYGSMSLYDSYLSPLLYQNGIVMTLGHERIKHYSPYTDKFSKYIDFYASLGGALNNSESSMMSVMMLGGRYGAFYTLKTPEKFRVMVGGFTNADFGIRTQFRNGNNPASAIINANQWLSAIGHYFIKTKNKTLVLRDHFSFSVFGLVFSPYYTQPYYDVLMLEDGCDGTVSFASVDKNFGISNRLTIDIPFRTKTLRAGLALERYRTKVNLNETRDTRLCASVGLVFNSYKFGGKRVAPDMFVNPIMK